MGKWALTPERLTALCGIQAGILARTAPMVAPKGVLAYATCSLLPEENEDRIAAFVGENPGWICVSQQRFSPLQRGDGFYLALLQRRD